jgi:hypothetical protein
LSSIHPITDRQDSAAAMRLLKAVAVTHLHNQRVQALSIGISIALAVTGLLTGPGSTYAAVVTLIGALWAAVYQGLMAPWAERNIRTAAALQEMFDADLLGLPWNRVAVGDRIGDDEVSRLSRRFRGDESRLPSATESPPSPTWGMRTSAPPCAPRSRNPRVGTRRSTKDLQRRHPQHPRAL